MDRLLEVVEGELLRAEANVAVLIPPQSQWVPVRHQKPLPNVEFGTAEE